MRAKLTLFAKRIAALSAIAAGLIMFSDIVMGQEQDPPGIPGIVVRPPASEGDDTTTDDSPGNQLGVVQEGFGQNSGVLRGSKSLFDSSAAATVRSQEQIQRRQALNMFDALQNEVGVLMQSTGAGQASPFVRGLTGQQVLILVDGVRLNNSVFRFGPNQYFNTIDPGSVHQIEVLRGQGSVLWGSDAIGGAINIVTRGANIHRGVAHGDYRGGSFNQYFNTANRAPYSRVNVEGWMGNMGLFAGGSFLNVRDLDTGWSFGRQPGTNYQQHAGDIKINYMLTDQSMLTFSLQHFQQDDLPRSDRFPGFPGDLNGSNNAGNARFFDPQQRDLAYIRYQALSPIEAIDALTFTASFHRQQDNQKRGIPEVRFQKTQVDTVGLNLVASKDLDWLGKFTTGFDWYHDDVDSRFGGSASGPIIPDDAFYTRTGVFLNWDVPLTERLSGVAGVRYEHINLAATPDIGGTPVFIQPQYQDWIGQVGLTYMLTDCINLVGSVSEGFRAPNLDELTANNPNVLQSGMDLPSLGLIPERSINYEAGVKTNFDSLRADVFVFWTDLNDNIVPISAGSNQFRRANQDSYINGVELNGEYMIDANWSLYGNFWYIYGQNLVTNAPLSRIPPMQGILGLRYTEVETKSYFSVYTWLVERQDRLDPVRDIGDERIPSGGTPGYGTLNMRVGRAFGECDQHRLSLTLENITDQPYLVHGSGVFGTGFSARFGYAWQF